jgi:hypothetical protein
MNWHNAWYEVPSPLQESEISHNKDIDEVDNNCIL